MAYAVYDKRLRFRDLSYGALLIISRLVEAEDLGEHLVPSDRGFIRIRIDRDTAGQMYVQRVFPQSKIVQEAIQVGVKV